MTTTKEIWLFIAITFGMSFLLAGGFHASGLSYQSLAGTLMATLYMFMPLIATLIVQKGICREKVIKPLQVSFKINRWFFVAWLLMPVYIFITLGVSLLFPNIHYSPEMSGLIDRFAGVYSPEQMAAMENQLNSLPIPLVWLTLIQGMFAGITINAVAAFGEEIGWRGFLLKQFQGKAFWKAALFIGIIWGVWHSPLILMGHNYPEHPQIGVLMMTAWCILLTPVFIYITLKSKSVIASAIMHGTLNGCCGITLMMIDNNNDLLTGATGLTGFIAIVIVNLLVFAYDRYISKEKLMTSFISFPAE